MNMKCQLASDNACSTEEPTDTDEGALSSLVSNVDHIKMRTTF